jgi:hypothetical protein
MRYPQRRVEALRGSGASCGSTSHTCPPRSRA